MVAESSLIAPRCEDCGNEVERGVEPVQLFRPVEGSLQDRVWNETTQKWVRRRGAARAGGRRMRHWLLCRRCRAEALRLRAQPGTVPVMKKTRMGVRFKTSSVMEGGKKRHLRSTERLEPKRGGRPRLLNDEELASLYRIYLGRGLSISELARRLTAGREKGTYAGFFQSILYGWRRLGYETRPRGVQAAMSRFGTDGTKSKPQMRPCYGVVRRGERKGKRCRLFARKGHGTCWDHRNQERKADA